MANCRESAAMSERPYRDETQQSVRVESSHQLRDVVDDDQVGPGVPEAEVGFIINSTELADAADTPKCRVRADNFCSRQQR